MLDDFGAAALRQAALATWATDPSRLRQDANLEEDHARGYYRDRVVVELAQNAADAAAAAGERGRLLLRLGGGEDAELLAANTGAPLSADGVAALASMRASAKRAAGMVGRFGVGFAAVRSVSDEITVASRRDGGRIAAVTFSLARTAAALTEAAAGLPALATEVERRRGDLPALRLPFGTGDAEVPEGYVTAVRVRLRGPAEVAAVRSALADLSDAALLALPALGEVLIEIDGEPPRRLAEVGRRWRTVRASGTLDPALLADRPVEERERSGWSVTWAVPVAGAGGAARGVVHAPTPTDEPCTLPALLIASFPLDPSRRHVAAGAVTDLLVRRAGELYAELALGARDQPAGGGEGGDGGAAPLAFVPTGLPAGRLDGALHAAALDALRRTPLLPEVGTGELLAARAAQTLAGPVGQDDAVLAALSPMVAGLVRVPAAWAAQARVLGVETRDLGEVVEGLPAGGRSAGDWRRLYAALAPHAAGRREALAALPVPLADGRIVRGARGSLLPSPAVSALWRGGGGPEAGGAGPLAADLAPVPADAVPADALAVGAVLDADAAATAAHGARAGVARALPGLRVVHPDAAHPALVTLGAVEADAVTVLRQEAVRAAVDALDDADGDGRVPAVVAAVLDLAAEAVRENPDADLPAWLAGLPLPGPDGEPVPAAELVLPGSWAARVFDALDELDRAVLARWTPETLRAVGVRTDLVTTTVHDVVAEPEEEDVVDGWREYLAELADTLGPGAYVGDVVVVADLDAVAEGAWPAVLARIAEDPDARAALLTPVRASSGGRPGQVAPSYTAWWLREELGAPFAHPRARTRVPFLPPAPEGLDRLDDAVLSAVGAVRDLAELDAAGWEAYAGGWPAEGGVPLPEALAVWRALPGAPEGAELAPAAVPALVGGAAAMVPAEEAVVAAPMWAQVRAVVPAPADAVGRVADLLDLDAVDNLAPDAAGATLSPTPAEVLAVLPGAPRSWWECEGLRVGGVEVAWWARDGEAWATTTSGLGRALAQASGTWSARHVLEAVLAEPARTAELLAELAGD
ncbi:sacsin N-terminal ATP-binding-like domain-containing protein [Georgenia sp. AZ-5]|uniref:sacsin N-terminal ATP-binding-like domain-containing protein n=1 Tax=Georgenia sp. AZ-5 TaxID=3367526 RepID=UPI0037551A03